MPLTKPHVLNDELGRCATPEANFFLKRWHFGRTYRSCDEKEIKTENERERKRERKRKEKETKKKRKEERDRKGCVSEKAREREKEDEERGEKQR